MNSKSIVIMGNGPSLAEVDFEYLRDKPTFGMNGAYRWYYENNWWPTYFGCFDRIVTDCHESEFKKMIESPDVPIERFFLLKQVSDGEKLTVIKLNGSEIGSFSTDFDTFAYGGNTGVNCCQSAICMGYKKLILVGIEGNYVQEVVEGAVEKDKKLVIEKDVKHNPYYFFENYQRPGDVYNYPQADKFHVPAWNALSQFAKEHDIDIVNCSSISSLTCFRKSTLKEEI